MTDIPVQDSRKFFMLPQVPEEAGYYTYGTPGLRSGQYAHPKLLTLILIVEHQWSDTDKRKFGVGNISLAGGVKFDPHRSHKSGLEVDIRPLRKDGEQRAVNRWDAAYDREATKKLIELFRQSGLVRMVRFNDLSIPQVVFTKGHDDHFHVDVL